MMSQLQKRKTLTLKHLGTLQQSNTAEIQDAVEVQNKQALKKGVDLDREARAKKRMRSKITLAWLCTTFPQAFDEKNPKALKTGIEQDIFTLIPEDSEITKSAVRKAISFYVNGKDYLQTVLDNGHRVDFNGIECESITEHQKQYSKERIQVLMEKMSKRKARRISQSLDRTPNNVK